MPARAETGPALPFGPAAIPAPRRPAWRTDARGRDENTAPDAGSRRASRLTSFTSMSETFSIAHVTPYPWEAEDNEVNAHIRRVAGELSGRGHRVLIVAPSRSQERVRDSRRALRAARGDGAALLAGTDQGDPRIVAVGEVLD